MNLIDELTHRINNHYGEVWAIAYNPANTSDKQGHPINTAIELHIGRGVTINLDNTSESSWSVKE